MTVLRKRQIGSFRLLTLGGLAAIVVLFALCGVLPKAESDKLEATDLAQLLISSVYADDVQRIRTLLADSYQWKSDRAVRAAVAHSRWPSEPTNWISSPGVGGGTLVHSGSEYSNQNGILISDIRKSLGRWIPGPGAVWNAGHIELGSYPETVPILEWQSELIITSGELPRRSTASALPTALGIDGREAVIGIELRGHHIDIELEIREIYVVDHDRRYPVDVVYSSAPTDSDRNLYIRSFQPGDVGVVELGLAFPMSYFNESNKLTLRLPITIEEHEVSGYIQVELSREKFGTIHLGYRNITD